MSDFEKALVVSHILYRKIPPYEPVEGPYTTDSEALSVIIGNKVETCLIPLTDYNNPVLFGKWGGSQKLKIPLLLGEFLPLKYITDFFLILFFNIRFNLLNRHKKRLIIGIDPLSCLPLAIFKNIFKYKLVFHSVDFNKNRFKSKIMQKLYEKADEISTKLSDQTWVVCESLQNYKKRNFEIYSFYLPNSIIYNESFYQKGKKLKTGNKIAWTGSFLTEKSFEILFGLFKEIQEKIRSDMKFYLAPTRDHKKFKEYAKKFKLKNCEILNLHSRLEWQKFSASYDVGIAVYDENFGSTEFIEPTKIWDFMMCGMPFIISSEPSVSAPIRKAGVAYFLNPGNKIPEGDSLKEFLMPKNIKNKQRKCLNLAKQFDIKEQIQKRLSAI
jgi:hypothetical protein